MNTHRLRKIWIPLIKTGAASIADTAGDVNFYASITETNDPNTNVYIDPLRFLLVVSVVMLFLSVGVLFFKGIHYSGNRKEKHPIIDKINHILAAEILFKNVPQYIIVTICSTKMDDLTPAATLALTTTSFNLFFNVLDMFIPNEEHPHADDEGELNKGSMLAEDARQVYAMAKSLSQRMT